MSNEDTPIDKNILSLALQSVDETEKVHAYICELLIQGPLGVSGSKVTQMAIVQGLLKVAAEIAYMSIASPVDIGVRTKAEFEQIAGAHWIAAVRLNASIIEELKSRDIQVAPEAETQAASVEKVTEQDTGLSSSHPAAKVAKFVVDCLVGIPAMQPTRPDNGSGIQLDGEIKITGRGGDA